MLSDRKMGLLLAFVALIITAAAQSLGWLAPTENGLLSLRYRLRGTIPPAPEVVIVSLEPESLREAGVTSWPPEIGLYTRALNRLQECGAAVAVLDLNALVATEWTHTNPRDMAALTAAMSRIPTVLPAVVLPPVPGKPVTTNPAVRRFSLGEGQVEVPTELRQGALAAPSPALCAAAAGLGHLNVYPDTDGVLRSLPLVTCAENVLWPSLALEAVRVFRKLPPGAARLTDNLVTLGEERVQVAAGAEVPINFAGGFKHYPYLPLSGLLKAEPSQLRSQLAGKVVMVGPTASDLTMLWRTPVHPVMPGVEINANVIGSLLRHQMLASPPAWLAFLLPVLWAMLLGAFASGASATRGALMTLAAMLASILTPALYFRGGVAMPMAPGLMAAALTGLMLIVRSGALAERERVDAEASLDSRLQAITGIGTLIVSSLDRTQLLNQVVRWVESELDVPAVSILLMDHKRRHLVFELASGEKGEQVKAFTLELGQGVAGTVAATGQPMIVQNAIHDPRQAHDISDAISYPARSILCVPMMLHGEVIGVIEALNKRSGPFTTDDEALLTVIAQQAALFLESARLYSELQQRVDAATLDLRKANSSLASQKAKIEALVDQMESGVIATDARDHVVIWNRMVEHLLGVPESDALGQPALTALGHPELTELFAMPLSPVGGRHTQDMDFTSGDRTLHVRVSITLVAEAEGGFGKLALLTDITQLKDLDRMKTDLISFVSHELKNPLTSIKGFAQILQRSMEGATPPQIRLVSLLNQQATRMQWLVEDFLDVTRLDAGISLEMRWQDIADLRALIQNIVDLQAVTAQDHQFVVKVEDDVPTIRADKGKLEQVLVNLLSNAVKYSPDGGEVAVDVQRDGDEIQFCVSDEGIGISAEEASNLFQRFRRAPGARERISGTGIGLFLSKHLIEAHGGRIWAEPRERGSRFLFNIPVAPPNSEAD